MTEQELRELVRRIVAERTTRQPPFDPQAVAHLRHHVSHGRLTMVMPTERGAPCVIEPTVGCNQCGYCQSLGH